MAIVCQSRGSPRPYLYGSRVQNMQRHARIFTGPAGRGLIIMQNNHRSRITFEIPKNHQRHGIYAWGCGKRGYPRLRLQLLSRFLLKCLKFILTGYNLYVILLYDNYATISEYPDSLHNVYMLLVKDPFSISFDKKCVKEQI